jgi:hypothetical protein
MDGELIFIFFEVVTGEKKNLKFSLIRCSVSLTRPPEPPWTTFYVGFRSCSKLRSNESQEFRSCLGLTTWLRVMSEILATVCLVERSGLQISWKEVNGREEGTKE